VITGQKAAVSLLISLVLIVIFAVVAFAGLFSVVEARFYQPAIAKDARERIEKISADLDEYMYILTSRFSALASSQAIQTSFETTLSDEDIKRREDFCGIVLTETTGLRGIRLVDSSGRRVHFSTFQNDVMRRSAKEITYNNYSALGEIDYGLIRASASDENKIYFDKTQDRLIFSFPVHDRWKAYRGSLIFYLDANDFGRYLVARNSIKITDIPTLAAAALEQQNEEQQPQSPRGRGFVFGAAGGMRDTLIGELESMWQKSLSAGQRASEKDGIMRLAAVQDSVWIAFLNSHSVFGIVAWLYPEEMFLLPLSARIILLASIFITVYLIIFLVFSVRRDPLIIIRNRIRRFQLSLIQEYFETKESVEWDKLANEIALRKHEVAAEIRKSLGRRADRHKDAVDALLEKNWEEILTVIGKKAETRQAAVGQVSTDELKAMLERILSNASIPVRAAEPDTGGGTQIPETGLASDEVFENVEEAEPIDEIGEALMDFEEDLSAPPEKILEIKEEIIDKIAEERVAARVKNTIEEELRIGVPSEENSTDENPELRFEVYNPDFSFLDAIEEIDDGDNDEAVGEDTGGVHEMLETESGDAPIYDFFGQTTFSDTPQELQSASADVVVEKNGVYTIPEDAAVDDVDQDPELKTLVDSVLK
jgi:hypothetical protein